MEDTTNTEPTTSEEKYEATTFVEFAEKYADLCKRIAEDMYVGCIPYACFEIWPLHKNVDGSVGKMSFFFDSGKSSEFTDIVELIEFVNS